MNWSGVDYLWIIVMLYQLFGLSFWRHPFTADEEGGGCISPNLFPWRNKLIYIFDGLIPSTFTFLGELF